MERWRQAINSAKKLVQETTAKVLVTGTVLFPSDKDPVPPFVPQLATAPNPPTLFLDTKQVIRHLDLSTSNDFSPASSKRIEHNMAIRPLVVIYADGLGGNSPKGRPFYEAVQKKNQNIEWQTAVSKDPANPEPNEWKLTTYTMLLEANKQGKDIMAYGYSAGATMWGSLLEDLTDPESAFYNPSLCDRIVNVMLIATPNFTSFESRDREKIEKLFNYRDFLGMTDTAVERLRNTFGKKTTILIGRGDTELNKEGKAMAGKLGVKSYEVNTDHGMKGLATDTTILNPELLAAQLFESFVEKHDNPPISQIDIQPRRALPDQGQVFHHVPQRAA